MQLAKRAMAEVITLPTAAADPMPKRRWHGQYPKGVTPISRQRYKREAKEFEAARLETLRVKTQSATYGTTAVLGELYGHAQRHEVAGLVLAWQHSDGTQTALICGKFVADRGAALEIAAELCDVIDQARG
jgi:hypothetical protein